MPHIPIYTHLSESLKERESAILGQPFQAGNVEQMVHGKGHVHTNKGQGEGEGQGHFSAGEEDVLKAGSINVHDPAERAKFASAGDLSAFMGGGGGGGGEGREGGGRRPIVADTERLMHGEGGHDHDIRKLRDLIKPKGDDDQAKDRFSNLHDIIMHDGNQHHDDDDDGGGGGDDTIRRGKTITYKDIMDLGLDEESLKGIDLNKLLLENAREYDDWQRERDTIKGESPESSFWEQLGELRKRYLSFGRNDGPARELTGTKLDPSQQKWLSEMEGESGERGEGEDSILHHMEVLGSTAARQDRHKQQHHQQQHDNHHTNGRDGTDL